MPASLLPGGAYRAKQNPDGTWNVFDVPIFATTTMIAKDGETEVEFTEDWLQGAVKSAQRAFSEDRYLSPLHVNHTSDPRGKRSAGFFLLKTVRDFTFEEETVPTVFADFLFVPGDVYEDMRRGRLPYVSIEANDVRAGAVSSCALMPDTVPHHKFPLFTIGVEEPVQGRTNLEPTYQIAAHEGRGAVSFARRGFQFAALSRFKTMAKLTRIDADRKTGKHLFTFDDGTTQTGEPGAFKFEADEAKPTGGAATAAAVADTTKGVEPLIESIKNFAGTFEEWERLQTACAEVAARFGGDKDKVGPDGKPKRPPTPGKPKDGPVEPVTKHEETQMSEAEKIAVEAKATADAAKAELAVMKATEARRVSISAAEKALEGYVFQAGTLENIYDKRGGAQAVELYVETRKSTGKRGPTAGDPAGASSVDATDLPADFEFSAEPTMRAAQVKYSRYYDGASPGTKSRFSRKRFIEVNTLSLSDLVRSK